MIGMIEILEDPIAQLILWATLLVVFTAVAVYLIGKFRGQALQDEQQERPANELLEKFRELHGRGGLSDAEFRTIKTKLAGRVEEELKGNGETG